MATNSIRRKADQTMAEYVSALDQGTTSNRFIIFDHNGRMSMSIKKNMNRFFRDRAGWVKQI